MYIPDIYWDYTSARVLTMEYVVGTTLSRRDELLSKGVKLKAIAQQLVEMMLRQIFIHGFSMLILIRAMLYGWVMESWP